MLQMDINQGVFLLNGHLVTGYSEDSDCLQFPDASELSTFKKGATGTMVSSRTGEKGGPVVVKLLPNSPSVAFFAKLIKQLDQNIPVIFNGSWTNPVAGESTKCINGTLISAPRGTTYGKGEVGTKVYTFEFEQITEFPEGLLLSSAAGIATAL